VTTTNPRPWFALIARAVFLLSLLGTTLFETLSMRRLPRMVAVHFDDAGFGTSFMTTERYRIFILLFSIGLPLILVALMTSACLKAREMKLPNRDYWMAPQRIARTREFLVAHGVWFGSLLVGLMCFVHWLVLDANGRQPPRLANAALSLGLLALLLCMVAWIGTLMLTFRRRR
jgi:hypothetical protein